MSEYPEHDKLNVTLKLQEFTQQLGEILDYSGILLCELRCYHCGRRPHDANYESTRCEVKHIEHQQMEVGVQYQPLRGSINQQLAQLFDVDLDTLEDEKRSMLELHRQTYGGVS